jgi:5-methyltetrahydrofolate--homocysteine methyltransferase
MSNKEKKVIYDPLTELMEYYSSYKSVEDKEKEDEKGDKPIEEKLRLRIIEGNKIGIQSELDDALKNYSAIEIINNILLEGMKTVGELFGSGQMQLPFVLQSAECMKAAVSYLEPYMDKVDNASSKGTIVIATVKGDVHDIGKNLVDIILTNNGYKVINLGIKCPLEKIINSYFENKADVIGMSGLLVKSTAVMKENLETLNERDMQIPVILGGAALNRRFVEGELRAMYKGDVYYANDAFDGLKLMEEIMEHKRLGKKPELRIYSAGNRANNRPVIIDDEKNKIISERLNASESIPQPPFFGSKIIRNISAEKIFGFINKTALFKGSWNVYMDRTKPEEEYRKLINDIIEPKFEELKIKSVNESLIKPEVIYGYFPCQSENNDLIIYKPKSLSDNNLHDIWITGNKFMKSELEEWKRFSFPRQTKGKFLCISDFFRPSTTDEIDVVAFQIVTVGNKASEYAQQLYKDNKYQDYLYFHGFSVECAEGLAEYMHKIIREELGIDSEDSENINKLFQQGYQGSRYSFGYPACPNLEDNLILFDILNPQSIGITLSDEYQMIPEQSTNAIIVHHKSAKYFSI